MNLFLRMKQHPILSYCCLVLLWSFTWFTLILTVTPMGTVFDLPLRPAAIIFLVIGLMGPILAGLTLTRLVDGKGGVVALLGRLTRWRVGWWWLALLIPLLLNIILYVWYGQAQGGVDPAKIPTMIGPAIGIGLTAGLFEEVGWRGFMLPKLQQRFNPLLAALLVGLFWGGVWHLYGDYVGGFGNRGWWGILLTVVQAPVLLTAAAVVLGWLYHRTKGSLLLCVLFHTSISSSGLLFAVTYPSNPIYAVWATIFSLLWWGVAGAVILLDRSWWAAQLAAWTKARTTWEVHWPA